MNKAAEGPLPPVLRHDPRAPPLPGYQVKEDKRYGRVVAGGTLLGVGHALTVLVTFLVSNPNGDEVGRSLSAPWLSLIPVAGPFIEGGQAVTAGGWAVFMAFPYLALAAMQTTGGGLHASPARSRSHP